MRQELIFKALADSSRRKLLDLLFLKDGRSLTELEEHLPMTRFGVMKHLRILKEAGLVSTRKSGRETLHYLNAVPLQLVYDRWVSKYARGWARSLTELKYDLEATEMAEPKPAETTKLVLDVFIKTTPEKLWQALTDGEITKKYYFNSIAESTWKKDADYKYSSIDGKDLIVGKVLDIDPPNRMVTTFNPRWCEGEEVQMSESRVTYEITPMGDACQLRLIHDELIPGDPNNDGFREGWSAILSGLKTVLETGEPLVITPAKAQ